MSLFSFKNAGLTILVGTSLNAFAQQIGSSTMKNSVNNALSKLTAQNPNSPLVGQLKSLNSRIDNGESLFALEPAYESLMKQVQPQLSTSAQGAQYNAKLASYNQTTPTAAQVAGSDVIFKAFADKIFANLNLSPQQESNLRAKLKEKMSNDGTLAELATRQVPSDADARQIESFLAAQLPPAEAAKISVESLKQDMNSIANSDDPTLVAAIAAFGGGSAGGSGGGSGAKGGSGAGASARNAVGAVQDNAVSPRAAANGNAPVSTDLFASNGVNTGGPSLADNAGPATPPASDAAASSGAGNEFNPYTAGATTPTSNVSGALAGGTPGAAGTGSTAVTPSQASNGRGSSAPQGRSQNGAQTPTAASGNPASASGSGSPNNGNSHRQASDAPAPVMANQFVPPQYALVAPAQTGTAGKSANGGKSNGGTSSPAATAPTVQHEYDANDPQDVGRALRDQKNWQDVTQKMKESGLQNSPAYNDASRRLQLANVAIKQAKPETRKAAQNNPCDDHPAQYTPSAQVDGKYIPPVKCHSYEKVDREGHCLNEFDPKALQGLLKEVLARSQNLALYQTDELGKDIIRLKGRKSSETKDYLDEFDKPSNLDLNFLTKDCLAKQNAKQNIYSTKQECSFANFTAYSHFSPQDPLIFCGGKYGAAAGLAQLWPGVKNMFLSCVNSKVSSESQDATAILHYSPKNVSQKFAATDYYLKTNSLPNPTKAATDEIKTAGNLTTLPHILGISGNRAISTVLFGSTAKLTDLDTDFKDPTSSDCIEAKKIYQFFLHDFLTPKFGYSSNTPLSPFVASSASMDDGKVHESSSGGLDITHEKTQQTPSHLIGDKSSE